MSATFEFTDEARLLDTREGAGFASKSVRTVQVPGAAGAAGVMITLTAAQPKANGFITVWNGVGYPPNTSRVNFKENGPATANTTSVRVAGDGSFKVYGVGDVDLIVDLIGVYRFV